MILEDAGRDNHGNQLWRQVKVGLGRVDPPIAHWQEQRLMKDFAGNDMSDGLPDGWDETIHAPWTADQVKNLNRFQREAHMHPFTCGRCVPHATLVATIDGWYCPNGCDYRQAWATAFMADPQMLERMQRMRGPRLT
jgi:hypothetical protein